MKDPVIYHLTTVQEWEDAQDLGSYQPSSFVKDGFIHCASESQVDSVLKRHFQHHENLVKLVIDPSRLTNRLQYDRVEDQNQEFPHIYGPLNIEAVTQII